VSAQLRSTKAPTLCRGEREWRRERASRCTRYAVLVKERQSKTAYAAHTKVTNVLRAAQHAAHTRLTRLSSREYAYLLAA